MFTREYPFLCRPGFFLSYEKKICRGCFFSIRLTPDKKEKKSPVTTYRKCLWLRYNIQNGEALAVNAGKFPLNLCRRQRGARPPTIQAGDSDVTDMAAAAAAAHPAAHPVLQAAAVHPVQAAAARPVLLLLQAAVDRRALITVDTSPGLR